MQTDYDKQAADFCAATGLTISKRYLGHRPFFSDEKDVRAVWKITFTREGRKPYTFTFGQSIVGSYEARDHRGLAFPQKMDTQRALALKGATEAVQNGGGPFQGIELRPAKAEPTDYDVLSCVEKRGCLSFSEFCDNYGYSTDSIKARDTYIAVQEQAAAIASMFTKDEVTQLEEIS